MKLKLENRELANFIVDTLLHALQDRRYSLGACIREECSGCIEPMLGS